MVAFFCEYPAHSGERIVRHPADRFTKKTTYVRFDSQLRLHELPVPGWSRMCRTCVELDAGATDLNQGQLV